MKKILIYLGILILAVILLRFVGFDIWLDFKFNQPGNILLYDCYQSRVYEMTKYGLIVWTYDLPAAPEESNHFAPPLVRLSSGDNLITDLDRGMVYEVDEGNNVIWKCDSLCVGDDSVIEWKPTFAATRVTNDTILIINLVGGWEGGGVMEMNRECRLLWRWEYVHHDTESVGYLIDAAPLQDGNMGVLIKKDLKITDKWLPEQESREEYERRLKQKYPIPEYLEYLEVGRNGSVLTRRNLDKVAFQPTFADMLSNGHVLVAYDGYGVVEYDTTGQIVWSFEPPDSIESPRGSYNRVASGAWGAYRLPGGDTIVLGHLFAFIYLVDSDGNIIWGRHHPCIKSVLGIQYVADGGVDEEYEVCFSAGIVGRQSLQSHTGEQ